MASKANAINYKTVAINAAISAIATAATLYFLNRYGIFKNGDTSGMAGVQKAWSLLPANVLARFANQEVMQNANDPKWLVEQFQNLDLENPYFYKNLTKGQVANFAFLSQYSGHAPTKALAQKIMNELKKRAL